MVTLQNDPHNCGNTADNIFYGEVVEKDDILSKVVTIAFGNNREDKHFKNYTNTIGSLIQDLHKFPVVPKKDGKCLLQGELVSGQRIAKNVKANYILMLDLDTGESVASVRDKVEKLGCFAVIWSTYSHLSTETDISEGALGRYVRAKKQDLSFENDGLLVQIVDYLRDEKRVNELILSTTTWSGRALKEGGMQCTITHAPWPKMRILFVLNEPFRFDQGGTQADRIDAWKRIYTAVSEKLGVVADRSCVDPSRLMYLPGRRSESAEHFLDVIDGTLLDLADFGTSSVGDVGRTFAAAGRGGALNGRNEVRSSGQKPTHAFTTVGLVAFARECPDFRAGEWLESVAPEDRRKGGPASGGVHWCCPNEDSHTHVSPEDTAFAVYQAHDGSSWGMYCMHDGCIAASGRDRLWYLDRLMVKYGVSDLSELRGFSDGAAVEEATKRSNDAAVKDVFARIGTLSRELMPADVDDAIEALAKVSMTDLGFEQALVRIKTATKVGITALRSQLKKKRAPVVAEERRKALMEAANGLPVISGSDEPQAVADTWKAVRDYNGRVVDGRKGPHIYMTTAGIGRIRANTMGAPIVETFDAAKLCNELNRATRFVPKDGGDGFVMPYPEVVKDMLAERDLAENGLQLVLGVTNTPKFSPDGEIITEPGFHAGTSMFYHPAEGCHVPTVSAEPTADEVARAVSLFVDDLLEGFAFRDVVDLTQHPDDIDDMDPSQRRKLYGKASRANCLAMFLLPFCRAMITGATPLHLINKRKPREGAGLLTDLHNIVVTGRDAALTEYTHDEAEMQKRMLSVMLRPPEVMAMDNLEGLINSTALKAWLTAKEMSGRILGTNSYVSGPVRWLWIANGINVQLSTEIAERTNLINLNAGVARPSMRNDFKHGDAGEMMRWARAHRGELIWAALTIIQNYIAHGAVRDPTVKMGGFDDWAGVMGGILRDAGVVGFMSNRDDLLNSGTDQELLMTHRFLAAWFETYGDQAIRVGDQMLYVTRDMTNPGGEGGLLALIKEREIELARVDLSKSTQSCRKAMRGWLDHHKDGVYEVEAKMVGSDAIKRHTVAIRSKYDSHSETYRWCLEVLKSVALTTKH